MTLQKAPKVYVAIAAVAAELAQTGIGKNRVNEADGYKFRGIDDIYNSLSPALAKHGLCIMPRVLDRHCVERRSREGEALFAVTVRVAFDFVSSKDGSCHTIETFGEALDPGDKATNKAMSAAYKYAAMQAFCIPVGGDADADARSYKLSAGPALEAEPVQGWEQWATDIKDVARSCETNEALDLLQNRHRRALRALAMAAPPLFAEIGETIRARRAALAVTPTARAA